MKVGTLSAALLLAVSIFASQTKAQAQSPPAGTTKTSEPQVLTAAQREAIKRIQADAEKQAAPAAARLAEIVGKIYENMLADDPDEKLRADLDAQMEKAVWALFSIKGQSIHDIVRVLTPAQRQVVREELKKPGAPADLSEVVAHTFKLDDK